MTHIEKILNIKTTIMNRAINNYPSLVKDLIETVVPALQDLQNQINALRYPMVTPTPASLPEKKQETSTELPFWKKFPIRLSDFSKDHEFCKMMRFSQGRLLGLVDNPEFGHMFDAVVNKQKSKTGNRYVCWIDEKPFLEVLLSYPFRNPKEKELVEEYKKQRGAQKDGGV